MVVVLVISNNVGQHIDRPGVVVELDVPQRRAQQHGHLIRGRRTGSSPVEIRRQRTRGSIAGVHGEETVSGRIIDRHVHHHTDRTRRDDAIPVRATHRDGERIGCGQRRRARPDVERGWTCIEQPTWCDRHEHRTSPRVDRCLGRPEHTATTKSDRNSRSNCCPP